MFHQDSYFPDMDQHHDYINFVSYFISLTRQLIYVDKFDFWNFFGVKTLYFNF